MTTTGAAAGSPRRCFDLDETLVVEQPAVAAAFLATAWVASVRPCGRCAQAGARAVAVRTDLGYCKRIGISSWEGLWCRWEGDGDDVRTLCDWSATYRRDAWGLALADQDVVDVRRAEDLGERFDAERRLRHEAFADAGPALEELRGSHTLAVVISGAPASSARSWPRAASPGTSTPSSSPVSSAPGSPTARSSSTRSRSSA